MEKKMTKEDYLRKKGSLPEKDLGIIYTFKSSRSGVHEIKESLIWKKCTSNGQTSLKGVTKNVTIQKYSLNESPYEIDIWGEDIVGEHSFGGSGFGDLWSYSHFGSLDKSALEEARVIEKQRIEQKYTNGK